MIEYRPIGIIHTPFEKTEGTPIQPTGAPEARGVVEVFREFAEGLADLEGFSHIMLLFHCHMSKSFSLKTKPFLDNTERGVFSTRAPARPNAIGLSTVRLVRVADNRLYVQEIDIVDGAPLLDIKPYVPMFDMRENVRAGWFEGQENRFGSARDDGRFTR